MKSADGAATQLDAAATGTNSVQLVGRVSADPSAQTLPSGDPVVTFRLVVDRPADPSRPRAPRVDTIDCTAWRADVRRTVGRWHAGDVVSISGSLRRRFWRGAAGPASRSEVEVTTARRLRKEA